MNLLGCQSVLLKWRSWKQQQPQKGECKLTASLHGEESFDLGPRNLCFTRLSV